MEDIKTVAEELIEKFGTENIFLVSQDYHGLYEDDYCNFTYWNNVNGSMPTDKWTTAMACPNFGRYECMTLDEGIEKGLVDMQKLLEYLKATSKIKSLNYIDMITEPEKFSGLGLRIESFKGRKWKGFGYLIGEIKKSYTWAVKQWRSDNDYGTSTTNYCKIYDPMTGRIEYVNKNNCRLIDEEKIKNDYVSKYNETVDRAQVNDIVVTDNSVKLKINFDSFANFVKTEYVNHINLTEAFDEREYEMRKKSSEFRTQKMNELIEWVKDNTDKKDLEVLELATRIFNKKYA